MAQPGLSTLGASTGTARRGTTHGRSPVCYTTLPRTAQAPHGATSRYYTVLSKKTRTTAHGYRPYSFGCFEQKAESGKRKTSRCKASESLIQTRVELDPQAAGCRKRCLDRDRAVLLAARTTSTELLPNSRPHASTSTEILPSPWRWKEHLDKDPAKLQAAGKYSTRSLPSCRPHKGASTGVVPNARPQESTSTEI